MAYNEILTGRHNRFIQKLFGMKGRPPAPQLSGDIQMSHAIFHGAENRWIESWNQWGVGNTIAAVAANTNAFQLRNPAGSGVIAVVYKMNVWTSSAAAEEFDAGIGANNADLLTVQANFPQDLRQGSNASATCIASSAGTSTGALQISSRVIVLPNVTYEYIQYDDQCWTLTPGATLRVVSTVANQITGFTLIWRERILEEGERQ
jgi:hypothetical protein